MGKKKQVQPTGLPNPNLSLTLRPVVGKQDVWTNDELQLLDLGLFLANGFRLFYCQICGICVPLEAIEKHLNEPNSGHTPIHTTPQTRQAHANLFSYDVPMRVPPIPTRFMNWMPALQKPKMAYRCNICDKDDPDGVWLSRTSQNRHKAAKHEQLRQQLTSTPITVQHLFPASYRAYNRFLPRVHYNPKQAPQTSSEQPQDQAQKRFQSFMDSLPSSLTLQKTMPQSSGSKDSNPFLVGVGWAKRVEGLDINELIRAVEYPCDGDRYFPVILACKATFLEQQKIIENAYPSIRRKWMTDSTSQVIFNPLGEAGVSSYTHRMVRLVAFVLRVAGGLVISGKDSKLKSYLTDEQKKAAKPVDSKLFCSQGELQNAIQNLLVTVFAPTHTNHLTEDKFRDILQDFCMLASIDRTGQFSEPKNITSPLAGIQYILRSVLLQKAIEDSRGQTDDVDKSFDQIQERYLTGHKVSPYGGLQSLKAQVWTYALTSTSLPNAQWANSDFTKAIIKGKPVDLDDLKRMVQQILADAEHLLYEDLLFGIPLSELGWVWSPGDSLVDSLGERKPGYNVFTEPGNAGYFSHLQDSVLKAFHHHSKTFEYFYEVSNTTGEATLRRDQLKVWLAKWEQLTGLTATLMHILGGQPPRSSELLCLYTENIVHRFRHLYWFEDHFFYVVCLNKVTNITGKDRIIVHGLPPEMNKFLLVMNGMVRHIAAAWSFQLYGENAFHAQNRQMFNTASTTLSSAKFSRLLQTFTASALGNPLGIAEWRHLCVLLMRKHFKLEPGEEQLEDEGEDSRWDLQAGHGSKVARKHYAIEAMEWHLMRDDTIAKYIKISREVSTWYLHTNQQDSVNNGCTGQKRKPIAELEHSDSDSSSDMDEPLLLGNGATGEYARSHGNEDNGGNDSDDYVQPASRSRRATPTSTRSTRSRSRKLRLV
ncbi:hypothetical protein RSOLAG22IIIB_05687 [Rhizoctonia solani]|uniref:Uncharacterized protein n=1 Tax=Rhizoctonia solani TaxID=456999 RepID=A0A0K6G7Y3_9AGAM|nr:hypothetical protein RSOLAG22IIIB_05687 [Rhizoctonia solani]